MAYASASDVEALTRNILGSASSFDTSTSPTAAQVTAWLSSGCAMIEARIGVKGYGAIPATSQAYGVATQANALWAAWMVERTRTSARVAADERTRADMLKKDYESVMKDLLSLDLSRVGVTQSSAAKQGGVSESDKDSVESDSDRVEPRFKRGMMKNKDSLDL